MSSQKPPRKALIWPLMAVVMRCWATRSTYLHRSQSPGRHATHMSYGWMVACSACKACKGSICARHGCTRHSWCQGARKATGPTRS